MTTQTEMFAKTELDEATAVLAHLLEERKKAAKAVASAEDKLDEAIDRVQKQQHVVDLLQAQQPAAEPAPMDGEAEDCEDAEIIDESHQIKGDVLDPITGEVTSPQPCVVAVFPDQEADDGEHPVATQIGEHTTYGELAADYLVWAKLEALELRDCAVIGEDHEPRKLREVIHPDDHGSRLHVFQMPGLGFAKCLTCRGDGRQPDKSGGGHHGECSECGGFGCVDRELVQSEEPAA